MQNTAIRLDGEIIGAAVLLDFTPLLRHFFSIYAQKLRLTMMENLN